MTSIEHHALSCYSFKFKEKTYLFDCQGEELNQLAAKIADSTKTFREHCSPLPLYFETRSFGHFKVNFLLNHKDSDLADKLKQEIELDKMDMARMMQLHRSYQFSSAIQAKFSKLVQIEATVVIDHGTQSFKELFLSYPKAFTRLILWILHEQMKKDSIVKSEVDPKSIVKVMNVASHHFFNIEFPLCGEYIRADILINHMSTSISNFFNLSSTDLLRRQNLSKNCLLDVRMSHHRLSGTDVIVKFRIILKEPGEFCSGKIPKDLIEQILQKIKPFIGQTEFIDFYDDKSQLLLHGVEFPDPFKVERLQENIQKAFKEFNEYIVEYAAEKEMEEKEAKEKDEEEEVTYIDTRAPLADKEKALQEMNRDKVKFLNEAFFMYENNLYKGLTDLLSAYADELCQKNGIDRLANMLISIAKHDDKFFSLLFHKEYPEAIIDCYKNATRRSEPTFAVKNGSRTAPIVKAINALRKVFNNFQNKEQSS